MTNEEAIKILTDEIHYIEHLIYPSDMETTVWVGNRIDAIKLAIDCVQKCIDDEELKNTTSLTLKPVTEEQKAKLKRMVEIRKNIELKPVNICDNDDYQEAIEHIDRNLLDGFSKPLAIEALEKQLPKKPVKTNYSIKCPNCEHYIPVVNKKGKMKYCPFCGQALNWSKDE